VALKLKRLGYHNVYPLKGGIEAWLEAGYPTDPVEVKLEVKITN
jgi:rhodanese-related sulfurtransferase